MNKKLDDLLPEEVINFNDDLNNDFEYFLQAFPSIEIGDTTDGTLVKLKVMPRDLPGGGEDFGFGDIFFDLQWRLCVYKKTHPTISKMVVSDLQLLPKLHGTAFPRGLAIKIKFI